MRLRWGHREWGERGAELQGGGQEHGEVGGIFSLEKEIKGE